MFKFFLHYPHIEPTHTRVGFYSVPLIVWIILSVFYTPNTPLEFMFAVLATLIITVLIPAVVSHHAPSYLTTTLLSGGKLPPYNIAIDEPILMCGKLNSAGTVVYLLLFLTTFFVAVVMLLNDYPVFLVSILAAFTLDLLLSLILFCTSIADPLCSAQAEPDGVLILNHLIKWQDVEISCSAAGFGLTKVIVSGNGYLRCYTVDSNSKIFIEYHSTKTICPKP